MLTQIELNHLADFMLEVVDCDFSDAATPATIGGTLTSPKFRNVRGYVTANAGAASIATGATSTTFSTDAESDDITFTPTNGRFTTTTAGDYRINATLSLLVSATSEFTVKVFVDGSAVYSQTVTVNSAADPTSVSINLIESLSANQYVRIRIERSTDENIYPRLGSSFTMNKLGPSSGGGGGGSGITIQNNVDGYVLKATGQDNIIEGMPQFVSSSTGLTASTDFYVSGSSYADGPYLAIQGTDADGNLSKIKLHVSGGFLKVIDEDIE